MPSSPYLRGTQQPDLHPLTAGTQRMSNLQKFSTPMSPIHDEAFHAILEAKYARIINEISQMHSVSLEEAMDIFYTSPLLPLLEEGVADLHCRSDKYLAEEIWREREDAIGHQAQGVDSCVVFPADTGEPDPR